VSAPEPAPVAPEFISAAPERGRRRLMLVLGVVLAVIVVAAIVLSRSTSAGSGADQTGAAAPTMPTDADLLSERAIAALESALHDSDRVAFLAAWDDSGSSQQQAAVLFDNLTSLRTRTDLDVTVTAPHADVGSADHAALGWDAHVDVSWGLRGIDRADAATRMVVHLEKSGEGAGILDIAQAESTPQPIWLMGPLTVMRDADTVTAASDATLGRQVERGLNQAHQDLADAGVHWMGTLVAYVPPRQRDFESMVEAYPGQYDTIAGVNASVDASSSKDSPQMIAINPAVFAGLTARGRRVVLTHEATHFATGAALSAGPMWLVEGYADYVAFGAAHIPIRLAARQALTDVTRNGPPDELPTSAAFSERGRDQQLAYERSWLVVRTIADHYGQRRLTRVYRAVVSDGVSIEHALHTQLSTTVPALTRAWRESLEKLAHAG
jgi:hypothetical protein